jgi:hypothetical protein
MAEPESGQSFVTPTGLLGGGPGGETRDSAGAVGDIDHAFALEGED